MSDPINETFEAVLDALKRDRTEIEDLQKRISELERKNDQ